VRKTLCFAVLVAVAAFVVNGRSEDESGGFPVFRRQDVETGLNAGWSLLVEDVNGDRQKDILVVAPTQVVWCKGPSWKPHTLVEAGAFKPNSMTISPLRLTDDGPVGFALGGGWTPKPFDTIGESRVVWLERKSDVAAPWIIVPIGNEPMIHRVRFADVLGEGQPQLIVAPMMGRRSTESNNWMDGHPVRLLVYRVPKNPVRDRWVPEAMDESLHVVHGLSTVSKADGKGVDLLVASYEGVHLLAYDRTAARWTKRLLTAGDQTNPQGSRGASDVKQGKLKDGVRFLATIEPWHGHQFAVYTEPESDGQLWQRQVIDDQMKYGHAIWCADLDADGSDEVIVGSMHTLDDKPGARRGIRLYKATDQTGKRWVRHVLDDGECAVEDLTAIDLSGSGRLDIVAVGMDSGKVRIFWNQGLKK
jgi:hypothetical protein